MNIFAKTSLRGLFVFYLMFNCSALLAAEGEGAVLYFEKACIACHGEKGNNPAMNDYPKIGAQGEAYLLAQMTDIKTGVRNNSHSIAMANIMDKVSDEEMALIAKWLSEQTN